jgi:hypothetical protein
MVGDFMNKTLIIASCGLLIALIVGATTQSQITPAPPHKPLIQPKCTELVEPSFYHQECAQIDSTAKKTYAEKFLRQIKRKAKVAFA